MAEWSERVKACRSSGQAVSEWCKEHGIASKTYYNWEREVLGIAGKSQEESKQARSIVALPVEAERNTGAAARIRAGGVTIEIERGADAQTIRAIIEAVRGC